MTGIIKFIKFSFDLRKCKNQNCCKESCVSKIYNLLFKNNRFLLLVIQGLNSYFLNPIHILEYLEKKSPGYNEHYPSITSDLYHNLIYQKYLKYFLSKVLLQQHIKITYLKKKVIIIDKPKNLSHNDKCNIGHMG